MRICLTGGHGFIGSHLLPALIARGHHLVLLARDVTRARAALSQIFVSEQISKWKDQIDFVRWDLGIPSSRAPLASTLASAEAVIHLAGENIGQGRWTTARKAALRDSRIQSTRGIVQALGANTRLLLSASAVGIYPQPLLHPQPHWESGQLSEDYFPSHAEKGRAFLEELVMDWEAAAMEAETEGRRVLRLRTGIVLGKQGFLAELLPIYRLGLGGPIGAGKQMIPWIHVQDLVRAIIWALEHENLQGAVNLVGPQPISFAEFSATLARVLRRPHLFRVPEFAIRLTLGEKSQLALSSCAALPEKLLRSGFSFEFPDCERALRSLLH